MSNLETRKQYKAGQLYTVVVKETKWGIPYDKQKIIATIKCRIVNRSYPSEDKGICGLWCRERVDHDTCPNKLEDGLCDDCYLFLPKHLMLKRIDKK